MVASVKPPILFVGVPTDAERPELDKYKAEGRQIIFFMTEAEKAQYPLRDNEAGMIWSSDPAVQQFLMDHFHTVFGGKIEGTAGIGAAEGNVTRAQRLASILTDVSKLVEFDSKSGSALFKENVPYRNMLKNHRWVEDGINFGDLKGKGKGITTILVAAGPSLDSQWEELKRIRHTVPNVGFMVAGRSYKQAMKSGLFPEFIMEVEQFEWDDRLFLFAPEPPPTSILVGPLTACPNLFHAWPNKGHVCITLDHNYAKLQGHSTEQIDRGDVSIDGGNSIAHHMFNFAAWLGSETICLAGFDFAYPPGHKATHAEGTFHCWSPAVDRHERAYQVPMQVPCTSGGEVLSSQPYRNFCTYMQIAVNKQKAKIPGLRVINFSPNGQKIEGTEYEDIKTWGISQQPSSSSLASGPVPFSASLGSASLLTASENTASSLPSNVPEPSTTASSEVKTLGSV